MSIAPAIRGRQVAAPLKRHDVTCTYFGFRRAIRGRESNPGWQIQPASLAKTERAARWQGELTNAHIPDALDAAWREAPEVASLWY